MQTDFERKFLVVSDEWRLSRIINQTFIRQGYLSGNPEVRVRIFGDGSANLAILSDRVEGHRQVFEYTIPINEAEALMELAKRKIEKTRYYLLDDNRPVWTVDEFSNLSLHPGLVLAETKLNPSQDSLPAWVGEEVTGLSRYSNISLAWMPI